MANHYTLENKANAAAIALGRLSYGQEKCQLNPDLT